MGSPFQFYPPMPVPMNYGYPPQYPPYPQWSSAPQMAPLGYPASMPPMAPPGMMSPMPLETGMAEPRQQEGPRTPFSTFMEGIGFAWFPSGLIGIWQLLRTASKHGFLPGLYRGANTAFLLTMTGALGNLIWHYRQPIGEWLNQNTLTAHQRFQNYILADSPNAPKAPSPEGGQASE